MYFPQSEINHVTDQLQGYAGEVANCVRTLEKSGFSREEAIEITKIAVEDIKAEVQHLRNKRLDGIIGAIEQLADSIEGLKE